MAAGQLAASGTEFGPCLDCEHNDCARTREMAATRCERCGEPIGYETGFFQIADNLVHALCEYTALEAAR